MLRKPLSEQEISEYYDAMDARDDERLLKLAESLPTCPKPKATPGYEAEVAAGVKGAFEELRKQGMTIVPRDQENRVIKGLIKKERKPRPPGPAL